MDRVNRGNKVSKTRPSSANQRGFSLLEVIVALSVAAIALTVLVKTLSQYANTFVHLRDRLVAQIVAVNQLSQRSLDPGYVMEEFVEVGGRRLELVLQQNDWTYRNFEDLEELVVQVFDEEGERLLTISTVAQTSNK